MKKLIAASIVSVLMTSTAFAYTVNLEQMQQEAICQSNAAVFNKECKQPVQKVEPQIKQCVGVLTDEATAKTSKVDFQLNSDNIISRDKSNLTYQVEDTDGSVTAYLDTNTGKGTVTVMNQSEVIYTGTINCK